MKDRRLIYIAANCAAYLALWFAVPHIGALRHPLPLLVLTACFMLIQLSIPRWYVAVMMRPKWSVAVLIVTGLVWFSIVFAVSAPYARYQTKEVGSVPVKITRSPMPARTKVTILKMIKSANKKDQPTVKRVQVDATRKPMTVNFRFLLFDRYAGRMRAVTSLLMIIAASAFGYLLSFMLRHPNILLPVSAFSAYVDIWTVLVGPTSHAVENHPHVVSSVSVAMPSPGSASAGGAEPMSFIGPADFIFFALFLGAIYRLKMEPGRTFWVAVPLLTLTMAVVLLGVFQMGFPALITIGFAVMMANYKHFKLKREEWIAMGIVAALLAASIVVLTPMMQRGR